ncbi:MFS transporter, partial [Escherichia sp. HC-CC]
EISGAGTMLAEYAPKGKRGIISSFVAMGTYGAGYVARIVGAFIFGKMGDRIGRKKVLFITITMMGICTTLIGVLPTYAQIGVFAPILLVTLRIIQGLGAGAEISGAGTMLAEYAP